MKKIGFLIICLILTIGITNAFAAKEERELSLGLGLAFPQDDLEDAVDTGVDLQGRYLQEVHPNLSLGGQLDLIFFGEDKHTVRGQLGIGEAKTSLNDLSIQAIGTIHPSGKNTVKPYGLVGLGLNFAFSETDVSYAGLNAEDEETEMDLTFSIGCGVDFPLQRGWTAGLSFRYQIIDVDGVDDASFYALMGHIGFPAK